MMYKEVELNFQLLIRVHKGGKMSEILNYTDTFNPFFGNHFR